MASRGPTAGTPRPADQDGARSAVTVLAGLRPQATAPVARCRRRVRWVGRP
jgi:hypothetical protein